MRVTHQATVRNRINQLQARAAATANAREKASTGRAFQRASDSPAAASKAADLRANLQRHEALERTHKVASGELDAADSALGTLSDVMERMLFIARASVGSRPDTVAVREAYVDELTQLRATVLGQVNITFAGRPLFAGTADVASAYDATGAYLGDNGDIGRKIAPNVDVITNVKGPQLLSGADPRDLITVVDDMITRLQSANPADHDLIATTDVPAVKAYREQIVQVRADVGGRANKLESTISRLAGDKILLTDRIDATQGVGLDEVLVELSTAETGYRAALVAASRAQDLSLANYL